MCAGRARWSAETATSRHKGRERACAGRGDTLPREDGVKVAHLVDGVSGACVREGVHVRTTTVVLPRVSLHVEANQQRAFVALKLI